MRPSLIRSEEKLNRPHQPRLRFSFLKTVLINLAITCALFLCLEISYRVWSYFRHCDPLCHDVKYLTRLDAFNRPKIHFHSADPVVGYVPTDGTFVINELGWNNVTVTIRQGLRINPKFDPSARNNPILAVGDSFVFGNQVSDDETWPALLEKRLNRHVANGGVSGYGSLAAVLRAEQLLKQQPYSLVILAILVNEDLMRDRWVTSFSGGSLYRPSVISDDGQLRHTTIAESRRIVLDNFLCTHPEIPEIFFWSYVAKHFFSRLSYDGRCVNILHPKAATEDEILKYVIERLTALPVKTAVLIQYPRRCFEGDNIEEADKIRDLAIHYGVQVIDTYAAIKDKSLRETYMYYSLLPHPSPIGNGIVADVIANALDVQ